MNGNIISGVIGLIIGGAATFGYLNRHSVMFGALSILSQSEPPPIGGR